MPTACLSIPQTTSLLLAPARTPDQQGHHTSVFPLLWQERRVSSLEAHSVACWGRTHITQLCHSPPGQAAVRVWVDRKLGKGQGQPAG